MELLKPLFEFWDEMSVAGRRMIVLLMVGMILVELWIS